MQFDELDFGDPADWEIDTEEEEDITGISRCRTTDNILSFHRCEEVEKHGQ